MCGIAVVVGPGADPARFARMLAPIAPRGDVEETLVEDGLCCGTQRLRIVDRDLLFLEVEPRHAAEQPAAQRP